MESMDTLTKERLAPIKIIFFDADGVTKPKGTEFVEVEGKRMMKTWGVVETMKKGLEKLRQYYMVCVTSGRSMSYLLTVYGPLVGERFFLESEIGMFGYLNGKSTIISELTTEEAKVLAEIKSRLTKLLSIEEVKGFETKERIITLHSECEVPEVAKIVAEVDQKGLVKCWWNGEAFDILPKRIDKGTGALWLCQRLGIKLNEVMTVGNGINDQEKGQKVGISVSTDPVHLTADFGIEGEEKGGEKLVEKILGLSGA